MNDIIINKLYADTNRPDVPRLEQGAEVSADSEDSNLAGGGYDFEQEQQEEELARKKREQHKQKEPSGEQAIELSQIERMRVLHAVPTDPELRLARALRLYDQGSDVLSAEELEKIDGCDGESKTDYRL